MSRPTYAISREIGAIAVFIGRLLQGLFISLGSLIRKKQRLTDNDTRQVQGDGVEGVLPFLNVGKRLN